jgi:hypothetical protein
MRLSSKLLFMVLFLPVLTDGGFSILSAADLPVLPAGTSLKPLAAPGRLRPEYHAEMIVVDWTHPLLRVKVVNGLPPGQDMPLPWTRVEREDPKALWIQLAEPRLEDERVSLALPVGGPSSPGGEEARRQFHFAVGGLCPWLPGGPPLDAEPELISPLSQGATRVAARWLSRTEDLDSMTSLTFQKRCLVSWTSLMKGASRFAVVIHEGRGEGRLDDLKPWLQAESRPGEWVAIHSFGEDALTGVNGWRLGGPSDPRRAERIGAALCLTNIAPGDPVDWIRLPGCTVRASSSEPGYAPDVLMSGLLWPRPFAPVAWIGQAGARAEETPWVEIDLAKSRPVSRIVLVWASAAGWSEQFNPRRARLLIGPESRSRMQLLHEFTNPVGPHSVWSAPDPVSARYLRIELPEPSDSRFDGRARLCAIQAWGPWDGAPLPRPIH